MRKCATSTCLRGGRSAATRAGGPETHWKVCLVGSNAGGQPWLGSDRPVGRNVHRYLRPNGLP